VISVEYCQTMAAYNAWQNRGLIDVMRALPKAELLKDRKGFFGSIFKTANHLLWGDQLWIARFDGGVGPRVTSVPESVDLYDNLDMFLGDRLRTDDRIKRWAGKLKQLDLVGPLAWHSTSTNKNMTRPKAECIVHFFNHQTHHRGQLHAMFTAAGHTPQATDLVFMPG
jgi:uncharacterized damage-inducible protein DinB